MIRRIIQMFKNKITPLIAALFLTGMTNKQQAIELQNHHAKEMLNSNYGKFNVDTSTWPASENRLSQKSTTQARKVGKIKVNIWVNEDLAPNSLPTHTSYLYIQPSYNHKRFYHGDLYRITSIRFLFNWRTHT